MCDNHSLFGRIFAVDNKKKLQSINYRFLKDELTFVIDGEYSHLMLKYEGDEGQKVFIHEVGFKSKKGLKNSLINLFGK